ncbi:hypothetical protein COE30_20625 [Bacillus cereus]|nr:hypothetical protein COE30_20625 [Bacillus cereus]
MISLFIILYSLKIEDILLFAAGVKLIKNRLGEIFSIIAFTCCVAVYPSIGGVILIPIAVDLVL